MSRISKDIRTNVKAGTQLSAVVVNVVGGKASVRLNGNGVLMQRLNVIGGPVEKDDVVKVDFTTATPHVVALSKSWLTAEDLARALRAQNPPSRGTTQITITLFSGGSVKRMYPPSVDGLTNALSDSNGGDVVFLTDVDLTGDFSVPAGVCMVGVSSRESIIRGNISIEPGCLLENLMAQNTSAGTSIAVTCKVTVPTVLVPTHKIKGCELYGYNCGASDAIGLYVDNPDSMVELENSVIVGDSKNGNGYAFSSDPSSYVDVYHSRYYGSTEVFYEVAP